MKKIFEDYGLFIGILIGIAFGLIGLPNSTMILILICIIMLCNINEKIDKIEEKVNPKPPQ